MHLLIMRISEPVGTLLSKLDSAILYRTSMKVNPIKRIMGLFLMERVYPSNLRSIFECLVNFVL